MGKPVSIAKFIRAIRALPSDEPRITRGKRYRTQKQHWLGWLGGYGGPGAHDRKGGENRDAQFAYNHVVEVKMLLWLIEAAGVPTELVKAARRASARGATLQQKSAGVRRHVPWPELEKALWGQNDTRRQTRRSASGHPAAYKRFRATYALRWHALEPRP